MGHVVIWTPVLMTGFSPFIVSVVLLVMKHRFAHSATYSVRTLLF